MEYHDRYGKRHSRDKDASYDEKANSKGTTTNHLETPLAAIYEICCHYRYHPIILFGLYTWMNNPESQMVAVTVRAGSKAEMALLMVHLYI